MSKIAILTDSSCDIPQEMAEKYGIDIMSFHILLDDVDYVERVDCTNTEFYDKMRAAKGVPSTAAITPIQFCEKYCQYVDEGYTDVIHVPINKSGSSTYNNALMAQGMLREERPEHHLNIHLLDPHTYSMVFGWYLCEMARKLQNGAEIRHVIHEFEQQMNCMEVVLDEPAASAEDVKKLGISVGDFVCFEPRTRVTKSGYIKSRFLDDKLSAAMLLALAKEIKDNNRTLKRKVYLHFTVYEEVGHGASASVPNDAEELISVDMGCVGDGLTCTEREVSICAKDSGGPYNYAVTTALVEAAKSVGAKYAVDVYPHYGSDVEASLRSGWDVRHGLIGAGVYASHGYERSHIEGVENTLKLLEAYVLD